MSTTTVTKLASGLTVVTDAMPHLETASLGVWVGAGSRDETEAEHGLSLAPNQSATKVAWLLNTFDANRERDLCFGTVDTWVAWVLSDGAVHATDHSNAAVTGLLLPDASGWSSRACAAMNVDVERESASQNILA